MGFLDFDYNFSSVDSLLSNPSFISNLQTQTQSQEDQNGNKGKEDKLKYDFSTVDKLIPTLSKDSKNKTTGNNVETPQIGADSNTPDLNLNKKPEESKYDFSTVDKLIPQLTPQTTQIGTENLEEVPDSGIIKVNAKPLITKKADFNKYDYSNLSIESRAALGIATKANPVVDLPSPRDVGQLINFKVKSYQAKPSENEMVDGYLSTISEDYVKLNEKYRSETGRNIVQTKNPEIKDLGNGEFEVNLAPTRRAIEILNAYGENGLEGAQKKAFQLNQEDQKFNKEYQKREAEIQQLAKDHPYLNAINRGVDEFALANTQLLHNIRQIPKAIYVGNTKGYDSPEYLDLINEDRKNQQAINIAQQEAQNLEVQGFGPKFVKGLTGAAFSFPKYVALGQLGLGALPTLTYLENLQRGNQTASIEALKTAVLMGSSHGLGEFLNAEGSISAFHPEFIRDRLTTLFDSPTLAKEVNLGNLSPFSRQLVVRGFQGTQFGSLAALDPHTRNAEDIASSALIGFSLPVGKGIRFEEIPDIPVRTVEKPTLRKLLNSASIEIPISSVREVGSQELRDPNFNNRIELGFEARNEPSKLRIPIDEAALNLLELKRVLADKSYIQSGDRLKVRLQKQRGIEDAISELEKAIPKEALDFFKENEDSIRAAIKVRSDKQREEFQRAKEIVNKPNKSVEEEQTVKEHTNNTFDPNDFLTKALNHYGETGSLNRFTNRSDAFKNKEELFKLPSTSEFNEGVTLPAKWVGDNLSKLTYLAAFHIEDFYRRSIEPSVSEFYNRLKGDFGNLVDKIGNDNIQTIFSEGMKYYQTNNADPFFSGMKQEAIEKLPNKVDIQQVRNVLGQKKFEDEFKWTGLGDFIKSKEGKIDKRELIDFIQGNQIRVEEKTLYSIDAIASGQIPKEDILKNELPRTKYGLKDYTGEKLELEGGENYKEFLLISPTKTNNRIPDYIKIEPNNEGFVLRDSRDGTIMGTYASEEEAMSNYNRYYSEESQNAYKSGHWDESNVLAHIRFNERIDSEGKRVLFIEEIQSDWNQTGRKQGYKNENYPDDFTVAYKDLIAKRIDAAKRMTDYSKSNEYRDIARSEYDKYQKEEHEAYINFQKEYESQSNRVPHNPFENQNWKELSIKRILRYAAENGFDRVGWTTTKQQQARYKHLLETKEIGYEKLENGNYNIEVKTENGWTDLPDNEGKNISLGRLREVVGNEFADLIENDRKDRYVIIDEDGKRTNNYFDEFKNARDYIKENGGSIDLAANQREGRVKGSDIKIGSGFGDYSKGYPIIFNKIGKRFGAKVGETSITVSDANRYKIQEGFSLDGTKGYEVYFGDSSTPDDWFKTYEDAEDYAKRGTKIAEIKKVHSIDITPSMRPSLLKESQPLYGTSNEFSSLTNPLKPNQPIGTRNLITNRETFDPIKTSLVSELTKSADSKGIVFNSGLNPEAFLEQTRLLYKGIKDLGTFSRELIERFGDSIKPYIEPIFNYLSDLRNGIDEWQKNIQSNIEDRNKVLMHIAGASGSGKTELANRLGKDIKNIKLVDLDIFDEQAARKLGFSLDKSNYTESMLERIHNTRQNLIDKFIEDSRKPIIFFGHIQEGDRVTNLPTDNKILLDVDPRKAITNRFKQAGSTKDREEMTEDLRIANEDIQFYKDQNYIPLKPQSVFSVVSDLAKNIGDKIYANRAERGILGLRKAEPEIRELIKDKYGRQIPKDIERNVTRATYLAQKYPLFGQVFSSLRDIQGILNTYSSNFVKGIHSIERTLKSDSSLDNLSKVIYKGNEEKRVYADSELLAGDSKTQRPSLSQNEINAYKIARSNQDLILSIRETQKLYREYTSLGNLDQTDPNYQTKYDKIDKRIGDIKSHFKKLRDEGYISLQRKGKYAVYAEDTNFPIGDPQRKVYIQTETIDEANSFIRDWKNQGFINVSSYEINKQNISKLGPILTPSKFEDLINSANVNPNDPDIQAIRDKVYEQYKTTSYELDREFIKGYVPDYRTLKRTMATQLEAFSNSYYGDVGKENAIQALADSGMEKLDPNMANFTRDYIKDETTAYSANIVNRTLAQARRITYFMALGYDASQFFLNAFSQPVSQTYSYFARREFGLSGIEPEKYFARASKLTGSILKEDVFNKKSLNKDLNNELRNFYQRAKDEHIVAPEYTKALLEADSKSFSVSKSIGKSKNIVRKIFGDHWSSAPTRAGEKVTRTHAFSEAYLVGKEKLNLRGDDLYKFMRNAVDATQGNFSKAENPRLIRELGEAGKLVYQFQSYGQIWFENLALAIKSDFGKNLLDERGYLPRATARHIAPIITFSGLTGLPFANALRTLVIGLFGDDPKKLLEARTGKDNYLRNLALYGVSGNAGVSRKLGINVPFLDNYEPQETWAETVKHNIEIQNVPVIQLSGKLARMADYIADGKTYRAIEEASPRVASNLLKANRFEQEGIKNRKGKTLVNRGKISFAEKVLQGTFGVTPPEIIEYYDKKRFQRQLNFNK